MRVLLDLRVSKPAAGLADEQQALAWNFSCTLVQALSDRHEVHVLLDAQRAEDAANTRDALADIISPESIHLWLSMPVESVRTRAGRETAAYLNEAVITRLRPDVVYAFDPDALPAPDISIAPFEIASSVPLVLGKPLRNATPLIDNGSTSRIEEAVRTAIEEVEHAATGALPAVNPAKRPRLAYLSPLPPQRSGIADYSAALLPELAKHYEIELIVDAQRLAAPVPQLPYPVRDRAYLIAHAGTYDRVLYHFGNSEFHEYMFELLELVPGTVVLHDFFLGDAQWHLEFFTGKRHGLDHALYDSHGYHALADRAHSQDLSSVVSRYPSSFEIVRRAQGIIFHSQYSAELMKHWYPAAGEIQTTLIPLLRRPAETNAADSRQEDRRALGLAEKDFLVCAFGLLGTTKLNDRLLRVWKNSVLGSDPRCRLVFVGENARDAYGASIQTEIDQLATPNVQITGWADEDVFRRHLRAADVAVQLRGRSRGETSAAVLDTMNHGVATVANAHGAMAWLPRNCVCMLDDDFTDAQLGDALLRLWQDEENRKALGARARHYINAHHSPERCGLQYVEALEKFAHCGAQERNSLITKVANIAQGLDLEEKKTVVSSIAANFPAPRPAKQLLLDVSSMVYQDLHTGIQRVVKSLLRELLQSPPEGFRVEPVFGDSQRLGYRYARRYTLRFLGLPEDTLDDTPISYGPGDQFIGLDLMHDPVYFQAPYLRQMQNAGVKVQFVVYDLLPVLLTHRFPQGSAALHARWLQTIVEFDAALCISQAVANELHEWVATNAPHRSKRLRVRSFPLGADLSSVASKGLPPNAGTTMRTIATRTSFLMVGTVEPRKGHAVALDAFELLWAEGLSINLVIVGKQGWMVEKLAERLRKHPEQGHRLIWIERSSDEYLELVYSASTCLVTASEGEGFGLPLIEGAQRGLSLISRDLPVFREVCGECAMYFSGDANALADAVRQWLERAQEGTLVRSEELRYLNWKQSAQRFIEAALGDRVSPG